MGKDPAFLFYPNDYIGGTMGLTLEQKGAYIELLMMQFNRGHMTKDMIGQVVGRNWGAIKEKFTKDKAGLWYNKRLEEEKMKRSSYVSSRTNNREGINQHTKSGHMTNHMEDENRIEDINTIILYLNEKTESKYSLKTKSNRKFVLARLQEGRTIDDFKSVIDKKTAQWLNDDKFSKYLRPETLFNATKFESYLNEKDEIKKKRYL